MYYEIDIKDNYDDKINETTKNPQNQIQIQKVQSFVKLIRHLFFTSYSIDEAETET